MTRIQDKPIIQFFLFVFAAIGAVSASIAIVDWSRKPRSNLQAEILAENVNIPPPLAKALSGGGITSIFAINHSIDEKYNCENLDSAKDDSLDNSVCKFIDNLGSEVERFRIEGDSKLARVTISIVNNGTSIAKGIKLEHRDLLYAESGGRPISVENIPRDGTIKIGDINPNESIIIRLYVASYGPVFYNIDRIIPIITYSDGIVGTKVVTEEEYFSDSK